MIQVKRIYGNFGKPADSTAWECRGALSVRLSARVDDDREILHWGLDQFLRPVARGGIEEQGISRFQKIGPIRMSSGSAAT